MSNFYAPSKQEKAIEERFKKMICIVSLILIKNIEELRTYFKDKNKKSEKKFEKFKKS